jgi:hypothetical protein
LQPFLIYHHTEPISTTNEQESFEKGALRNSKYFFDHSRARFTANERRRRYFVPQLALRAQTLNLRAFHFAENGYRKNLDSRSELTFSIFQQSQQFHLTNPLFYATL